MSRSTTSCQPQAMRTEETTYSFGPSSQPRVSQASRCTYIGMDVSHFKLFYPDSPPLAFPNETLHLRINRLLIYPSGRTPRQPQAIRKWVAEVGGRNGCQPRKQLLRSAPDNPRHCSERKCTNRRQPYRMHEGQRARSTFEDFSAQLGNEHMASRGAADGNTSISAQVADAALVFGGYPWPIKDAPSRTRASIPVPARPRPIEAQRIRIRSRPLRPW